MRGHVQHLPVRHHDDAVGVSERREPVGDDERGAVLDEQVERALDQLLVLGVDGGRGLVQNQQVGVLENGPRDADALPLAAAEAASLLARVGVVGLGELHDEIVCIGDPRGPDHVLLACLRLAVTNVLQDRFPEQEGALAHGGELFPERFQVDLGQVPAVDEDAAAGRVVEAAQQLDERRFARAAGADDADRLARLHLQRDVLEHRRAAFVVEAHVLQADALADAVQLVAVFVPADDGFGVEHVEDSFGTRRGILELLRQGRKPPDRHVHQADPAQELDQVAEAREFAVDHGQSAEPVHQHGAQLREQDERRGEPGGEPRGLDDLVAVAVTDAVELAYGPLFLGEGLHYLDAGDGVGQVAAQCRPRPERLAQDLVDVAPVPLHQQEENGQREPQHHRQFRRATEHPHQDHEKEEQVHCKLLHLAHRELLQLGGVRDDA